jgi:hypothetical protein
MVQGYERLGLPQLRDDAKRVLAQTFPDSTFLRTDRVKPWWMFWQPDEVVQLLEHNTVPKSQENAGPPPPSTPN